MSLIKLIYVSYMHRKKYMILVVYQIIAIALMVFISKPDGHRYEVLLYPGYYQSYIESLFLQIFLILNAMFVLFLALDHDQSFMKPLISFFGRTSVLINKYIFFVFQIAFFYVFIYMLYLIIPTLFIKTTLSIDIFKVFDMFTDMMIILNLILILIKDKYKTLAILIVLVYILMTLFISIEYNLLYYVFPIFRIDHQINMIEIYYKLCYISLGFSIYWLKSLKEEL